MAGRPTGGPSEDHEAGGEDVHPDLSLIRVVYYIDDHIDLGTKHIVHHELREQSGGFIYWT